MNLPDQMVEYGDYSRKVSAHLYEEAKQYFPGGVNSPVRAFKSVVGPPIFIKKGEGATIIDEDENSYIDFCGSWGPLILGHNNELVKKAIIKAVEAGSSFGTPTRYGLELGKLIIENNRFIEMLRFVSSGTEAVMSAIRLARGFTNKPKILKFEGCYHGHVDSMLVKAGSGLVTFGESSSAGITSSVSADTFVIPLANEEALIKVFEEFGDQLACAIIEPIPANNGLLLQDASFLELLRKLCYSNDVLLIFDEVISGFRVGFEGAAGYYNIEPDLITYGKIIGGGMPVGAYGGKAKYMKLISPEGPVYQAGTLSGNPVAMAAGHATLSCLLMNRFYSELEEKTNKFVDKISNYCIEKQYPVRIPHIGSIFWISFSKDQIIRADQIQVSGMEKFKHMHLELLSKGVYFGPSGYEVGFVSSAHSNNDLDESAKKICQVLDLVFKI